MQAKKYNLANTYVTGVLFSEPNGLTEHSYSDFDSIATFNETGAVDFTYLLGDFEDAYSTLEQDAGYILTQNLQDRSARAGLSLAGWKPGKDSAAQAVEWWEVDFEYAAPPVCVMIGLLCPAID